MAHNTAYWEKNFQKFNSESNTTRIVDILTKTDNSLADFFQKEQENKLLQTALKISAEEIDLRMFCGKTGKPLVPMSLDEFAGLVEIHGEKRAVDILESNKIGKIDPRWLYTDPDALAELLRNDPLGYFVYACSSILIPVQDSKIRDKLLDKETRKKFQIEWMEEKRKCWDNIQAIPMQEIFEANQIMTQFLSIFRTNKVYAGLTFVNEEISPATIGIKKSISDWIKDIRNSIENILVREIKKGKIKRHLTLQDIANLKDKFEGYSNFRGMKRKTRVSENEEIIQMLDAFIPDEVKKKYRSEETIFNTNRLIAHREQLALKRKGLSPKTRRNGEIKIDTSKPFKLKIKGRDV